METAELHGKRANRAAGARPVESFVQAEPIRRRVPGGLHPATFAHRLGLGDADREDGALEAARLAFSGLSRTLQDLHGREKSIRADQTQTAEAHALRVAQLVNKNLEAPATAIERARNGLLAEVDRINSEIEKSCRTAMDREDAQELRAIIRGLSPAKRREYFSAALSAGNSAPLAAALAHPEPIASGMTATERAKLRADYEKTAHGEAIARRGKLQRGIEELDAGWMRYLNAAVAMRDGRADSLEKAAAAAEDAMNKPLDLDDGEAA